MVRLKDIANQAWRKHFKVPPYRVNQQSIDSACSLKELLSARLAYPMEVAVSTRSMLWLDFDCPSKEEDCLLEAMSIAKAIRRNIGGKACVFETPHGYHVISYYLMRWDEVKRIMIFLAMKKAEGKLQYLDTKHIEACIRRGYATLRLNQLKKVVCYE